MKAPPIQWFFDMEEMGRYRISTKNGIDSLVAGG
jgi:hypothetical protein